MSFLRRVYSIQDIPFIYWLSQWILAPGFEWWVKSFLKKIDKEYRLKEKKGLDVGCGPHSLLWKQGIYPDGVDLGKEYVENFNKVQKKGLGKVMSATSLDIPDHTYDFVFSIGLIHHLDDDMARKAISEMERVCKKDGVIIIVDAVLPKIPWLLWIPYFIRKLDRGDFVRKEENWLKLVDQKWSSKRYFYTINLLECLVAIRHIKN